MTQPKLILAQLYAWYCEGFSTSEIKGKAKREVGIVVTSSDISRAISTHGGKW